MPALPLTPWSLLALSVLLPVVTALAAAGVGADRRVVGFHVPFVHASRRAWIGAHRAARWAVLPFSLSSAVLAVAAFDEGRSALVPVGWALWFGGLVVGGLTAMAAARRSQHG